MTISFAIIVLRSLALLALAAPMLLRQPARRPSGTAPAAGWSAPVIANAIAFVAFWLSLFAFAGSDERWALPLSGVGAAIAAAGAALILRSRKHLGEAWSLVPKASGAAGVVTSGPYRLVRHPIY
ncbi:MAG TPA: hypothetical protein VEA16_01750, partial [Vicinamibacterales bacterium]|nr:hypothetical protein [Vicinamibacterales bacterium]